MNGKNFFFQRIEVKQMPGFPTGRGFTVSGLCSGVNIIYGPNASGKTTLARAIHILLHGIDPVWTSGRSSGARGGAVKPSVELAAQVRWGDTCWNIHYHYENKHSRPAWQRVGESQSSESPLLVLQELRRHYLFGLPDLLASEEKGEDLVSYILCELYGGYDLAQAYKTLEFKEKFTPTSDCKDLEQQLTDAKEKVRKLQQDQERIFDSLAEVEELRQKQQQAEEAAPEGAPARKGQGGLGSQKEV